MRFKAKNLFTGLLTWFNSTKEFFQQKSKTRCKKREITQFTKYDIQNELNENWIKSQKFTNIFAIFGTHVEYFF